MSKPKTKDSLRILNEQLNQAKADNDTRMVRIINVCIKRIIDQKMEEKGGK